MASVSVQNLSIAIGKNTILQNININFREGKRTAIIGPNGCGKSTLLRAVAGLNRNYSGKVLLNGADMKNMPRRKIAEMLAILPAGRNGSGRFNGARACCLRAFSVPLAF